METSGKQQAGLIAKIAMFVFLGITLLLSAFEIAIALVNNTHVLGFCFAILLFLVALATLVLIIIWNKRGVFFGFKRKLVFGLLGFCAIFLWFIIAFIAVKLINYNQPYAGLVSNGKHDRYTEECTEEIRKWAMPFFQSRAQDPILLKVSSLTPYEADAFVVHGLNTDVFLGLVVDGVYKIGPYVGSTIQKIQSITENSIL